MASWTRTMEPTQTYVHLYLFWRGVSLTSPDVLICCHAAFHCIQRRRAGAYTGLRLPSPVQDASPLQTPHNDPVCATSRHQGECRGTSKQKRASVGTCLPIPSQAQQTSRQQMLADQNFYDMVYNNNFWYRNCRRQASI